MHPHKHALDVYIWWWVEHAWLDDVFLMSHIFLWCFNVYVPLWYLAVCSIGWYDMHDRYMLGLMWVAMIDAC